MDKSFARAERFLLARPDDEPILFIVQQAFTNNIEWPYSIPLVEVVRYLRYHNNQLPEEPFHSANTTEMKLTRLCNCF